MMSLAHRLYLASGIVLSVFMILLGLVLDSAFTISLENIVKEKLRVNTYALLSNADMEGDAISLPSRQTDGRLNEEDGDLLAFVARDDQSTVWSSISAADQTFTLPAPEVGEWIFGRAQGSNQRAYYVSSYSTLWTDEWGDKHTFVFSVMEDMNYYSSSLNNFRLAALAVLFLLAGMLMLLQALIFKVGLQPVRGLSQDVDAMNRGEVSELSGNYPRELLPLTENVNLLVENERRQRERYRDRMADLSHSLKTPLSVLRGLETDTDEDGRELSRSDLIPVLSRQVGRMRDIIDYQLQRAVASSRKTSFVATPMDTVVESIASALTKVYRDKGVSIEIDVGNSKFFGDENDLMEVLGNVLDNACKHCIANVILRARTMQQRGLQIEIEDDGAGISEADAANILKRGVRLDTTVDGQGLGLSIVVEIVASYDGEISVHRGGMGGALFRIVFPGR